MSDSNHNESFYVDWVLGASMMIDRKLFSSVGMFDENFFLYCEDIDLCYRLKKLGYLIGYVHNAKMYHEHQKVSDKNFFSKNYFYHIKSMIYFLKKHKVYFNENTNFDFIVIGTGMGGGTFGFALAKRGFKVLFIEKGNNYLENKTLKGNYSECYDKLISNQDKRLKLSGRAFSKVYNDNKLKFPFIGSGTGGSSLYGMAMEIFP